MDKIEIAKFAGEFASLTLAAAFLIKSHNTIRKDLADMNFLRKAYVFTPKALFDQLEENLPEILFTHLKYLDDNDLSSKFLGFIKGVVTSNSALNSLMSQNRMILKKAILEPIYSNSERRDPREAQVRIERVPEFTLKDPSNDYSALVKNDTNMNFDSGLMFSGTQDSIIRLNSFSKILSKILLTVQVIFASFRIPLSVRGWRIGTRSTEYGIFLGQIITVFGKIAYDKKNKTLAIEKPLFFLKDKSQIVEKFKSNIKYWRNVEYMSIVLSTVFLILVIRRVIRIMKMIKRKIIDLKTKMKMDKLRGISDLLTDDFKCIICIENLRNVIFKPCLHLAVCKICFEAMPKKECPACRCAITDKVCIFVV